MTRDQICQWAPSPKYGEFIIIDYKPLERLDVKQRRYFTLSGGALQDIDYYHGSKTKHLFPHVHLYDVDPENERSFAIRYADQLIILRYAKGVQMDEIDLFKYKEQSKRSGAEWRKRCGYSMDNVKRFFSRSGDNRNMTLDELMILLSHGHELEVEYNGWEGFVTPDGVFGFSAMSAKGEERKEYESIDIEEFADNAMIGPYYIKDIVGEWKITHIF